MGASANVDASWWETLFAPEPEQWGLRGDPYAWRALRDVVRGRPKPSDTSQLAEELRATFARVVGVDLNDPSAREPVEVSEFAHGGMSSGMVDLATWRERLMPLLLERGTRQL